MNRLRRTITQCGFVTSLLAPFAICLSAAAQEKPRFTDVTAGSGIKIADNTGVGGTNAHAVAVEDFDRNNRNGTFTDIAAAAGVTLADRHSLGCAFGDVDGDGRDDLLVTSYRSQVSALFRNSGGGEFRDVTAAAGLVRKSSAVGGVFADVLNRGRLDLLVTTDSWLSGANYTEPQLLKQGHTVEPNLLYLNDGRGKFSAAPEATLRHKTLSHDAVLEDLDHDGLIDIYVGVDAIPSGNRFATNKGGNPLWTRSASGAWHEAATSWGIKHEGNCVCVPAVDLDNDGDLDLLLINFYSNALLYRNNTDDDRWLRVKAIGNLSNPDGVGAKIKLFAVHDKGRPLIGFREVQSGAGYCRSSPLEAHFGLGRTAATSYELEVRFPGAKSAVVVRDLKPAHRVVVKEVRD